VKILYQQIFLKNKNKTNVSNKYIIKYKEDIQDIVKHICYCCQRLCFAHQVFMHHNHVLNNF